MDVEVAKRAIADAIADDPSIAAAWLYGSVAQGTNRHDSDVDVAILKSTQAPQRTLDDLPLELEDQLSRRLRTRVQVVDLEHAPDDLAHRVFRDGILVIDREPGRRVEFEVGSRNRYFDMLPIWREYRRGAVTP